MKVTQGVWIVGETINELILANDTACCAETEKELQNNIFNINQILWDS